MFNAPRPAQRYVANPGNNAFGATSFVDENPLSGSAYDGLDPWSASPSPIPGPSAASNASVFRTVIADAAVPSIYNKAFDSVDPDNTGETSVNGLSRILGTSSLPAATIDKIVNLVSSRPRVSKEEFFVALALVALAQSGKDVSIEQVASLSSQNTLPEPNLNLDTLPPSTSTFSPPMRQNTTTTAIRSPVPAYASDDPWNTARFTQNAPPFPHNPVSGFASGGSSGQVNGTSSSIAGSGLPQDWWKRQETVHVRILGQQGFILNRYTVYEITTDRAAPVSRRYSEFVFLWDCLVRRYPFRLFPALPPKRIGPDEYFLEQRRRGLARALNFVINHPVIREDGILAVFLTQPSFDNWRRHSAVSLDEEASSKRVDKTEEMGIPSDLEEKLAIVRGKLNPLIEQWQRICILSERIIKRREAAAVRDPPPTLRRSLSNAHFLFPRSTSVDNLRSAATLSSSVPLPPPAHPHPSSSLSPPPSLKSTNTSSSATSSLIFGFIPHVPKPAEQGDLARLTNTLRAVVEVNAHPWRGDDDELSSGVRHGLEQFAAHTQRHAEISELRTRTMFDTTLEALKTQRDLYIAMRDLYVRHDRLSIDQVERLKKRVETSSSKLEGVRATQKDGWQDEADKIVSAIEKDQATIATQLSRRVFVRACMWHELRVVLHNRENTLLTVTVQTVAKEEQDFLETVLNNWVSLGEAVESMPLE